MTFLTTDEHAVAERHTREFGEDFKKERIKLPKDPRGRARANFAFHIYLLGIPERDRGAYVRLYNQVGFAD